MRKAFQILLIVCVFNVSGRAQDTKSGDSILIYSGDRDRHQAASTLGKPVQVKAGLFEKAVQDAIKSFENSMRGTCAKEMEVSITVTAEGKWAIVGVSVSGAMKLLILNPEMTKNCSKN